MDAPVRHHAATKNIRYQRKETPKVAIIGIDFGTSYTKAFCSVSDYGKFAVKFDNPAGFFLPSVLYYCAINNTLSFKSYGFLDKIEYFKYGLLNQNFPTLEKVSEKNPNIKNSLSLICSVFYLAKVIVYIKSHISKECRTDNIEYHINMGCPIENFGNDKKGIYDKALNIGALLSREPLLDSFSISKIDDFITENENVRDSSLETIPELYAEALWFIEQPFTGDGVYTILDVGGGTTDCATITIKWENGQKVTRIYSQSVLPLGVEVLLKELYPDKYRTKREECVKELREMEVVVPVYGKDLPPLEKKEHLKAVEFQKGFFGGVMEAKNKDKKLMSELVARGAKILYYTFGGGSDVNFFHSIIKGRDLKGTNIPPLVRENVKTDLPSDRLIIAEQLARPYFPEIMGFPWDFVNEVKEKEDSFEFADYGILDT